MPGFRHGEALLAECLNRFVTFRQLALMASAGSDARAGASGQDGADLSAAAGAASDPVGNDWDRRKDAGVCRGTD